MTEETPKEAKKNTMDLAKEISVLRGKFARQLKAKHPDYSRMKTMAEEHSGLLEALMSAAVHEQDEISSALQRIEEIEEQKAALYKDLNGTS